MILYNVVQFTLGKTRRKFIEKQQFWRTCQGPCKIEPFQLYGVEIFRNNGFSQREFHKFQQLPAVTGDIGGFFSIAEGSRGLDIFKNRHLWKRSRDLEGSGKPPPAHFFRRQAGCIFTEHPDGSGCRGIQSCNGVEKGCLPAPLGPISPTISPCLTRMETALTATSPQTVLSLRWFLTLLSLEPPVCLMIGCVVFSVMRKSSHLFPSRRHGR